MKTLLSWALGIATLVGAIAIWWSKKNQISNLRDALEVQRLRQDAARAQAEVDELVQTASAAGAERAVLEAEVRDAQARAVAIATGQEGLEKLTSAEIAQAFTEAGF